jgi:hypothetical protein
MKKCDCVTVMELVDEWVHWRKGQCDFPDGLSEVERKLLSTAEVKKEGEKRGLMPRYMVFSVFGLQLITDTPLTDALFRELRVPLIEAKYKVDCMCKNVRFFVYINGKIGVVEEHSTFFTEKRKVP